jgi:DNA replication and repair protein RecF
MERQQVAPGRQAEAQLTSLSLRDFRNYADCRVTIGAPNVLLLGENGAGKTNLMEAVSLLAPGRGLRRARAEHLPRQDSGGEQWAVSAELLTAGEVIRVGTGVPADSDSGRRIMRRDGETVSQTEIGRLLSVSWLTPRMDGIFVDSPGARRRFLDRLVIAFDAAHIGRTNRYEKLLRERGALLAEGRADEAWFSAIEASLAESAIAVTAARQALIADLNAEAAAGWFDFPGVRLALDGTVEGWLAEGSALQAEDRFIAVARTRRMAGDTALAGPHSSDMNAVNSHTDAPAHLASTGQQKALLIAVVLAHARLQARRLGRPPLLLLDDVVAHLDVARRAALFEAVGAVGAQAWFSGTDHDDFEGLDAQSLSISADAGTASITQSEE